MLVGLILNVLIESSLIDCGQFAFFPLLSQVWSIIPKDNEEVSEDPLPRIDCFLYRVDEHCKTTGAQGFLNVIEDDLESRKPTILEENYIL